MFRTRVLPLLVLAGVIPVALWTAERVGKDGLLTPPAAQSLSVVPHQQEEPPDREGKARAALEAYLLALSTSDLDRVRQSWSTDPSTNAEFPGFPPATGPAQVAELHRNWMMGVHAVQASGVRLRVQGPRAEVALLETVVLRQDGGRQLERHVGALVMLWTDAGWRITSHRILPRGSPDAGAARD